MKGWIKVHIECTDIKSEIPEDLQDVIPNSREWRQGWIQLSHLSSFYPDGIELGTLIEMANGDAILVQEHADEVAQLIQIDQDV